MSDFIEEFYYGNIEPQECTTKKESVEHCLARTERCSTKQKNTS